MNVFRYLKKAFVFIISVFFVTSAQAQSKDTLLYPFRILETGNPIMADSLQQADYFRVIYPYTKNQPLIEVKEFYKDGRLKLVGQAEQRFINQNTGYVNFIGQCISFYPSGIRSRITNYSTDGKDGDEYVYYPDGQLFKHILNTINTPTHNQAEWLIDCFDKSGKQLCEQGNGEALEYDYKFTAIKISGAIKDGLRDGDWKGNIPGIDSGYYIFSYKNGKLIAAIGYDRTNTAYPFKQIYKQAECSVSPVQYVSKLRNNIKLPNVQNAKKIIDSTQLSFHINQDGRLTDISTVQAVPAEILQAIKEAVEKSPKWTPSCYYGVPLQSNMTITLNIKSEKNGRSISLKLSDFYNSSIIKGMAYERNWLYY